jgi:phosphoglycolate phosphatase-like HAD superfamily hydrolase
MTASYYTRRCLRDASITTIDYSKIGTEVQKQKEARMSRPVIFLDDGGVMNDNWLRGTQWQRMVAEFFVPRLGGTPEAWIAANYQVITHMLDPEPWQARLRAAKSYADFDRKYQIDWLRMMCELVGVAAPTDEECVAFGHAATSSIIRRVRAAFPGVVDAIRALYERGYVLHTASGESSDQLNGYLQGMGVRDCFGRLYGPDLVETFKDGSRYYERIFADAGVEPGDALVVDDNATAAGWAAAAGARTALIGATAGAGAGPSLRLGSLAELPTALERLDESDQHRQ